MSWFLRACSTLLVTGLVVSCSSCGAEPAPHPLEDRDVPTASDRSTGRPQESVDDLDVVMTLGDSRITESSGLARSWNHAGVLYTHNDRGSGPEIFAVAKDGTHAVLTLQGATAHDWEDMASTPDGRLWVADTGGAEGLRRSVTVHVVREPDNLVTGTVDFTGYAMRYPEGRHDAEALLVNPTTSRVYVVTKDPEGGEIYVAPRTLSPTGTNPLRSVTEAPPNVTAGDFSPDGTSFVLRSYGPAYFYEGLDDDSPVAEPMPDQQQGESIAFDASGTHVLVGTEGANSKILRVNVPAELLD